MLFIKLKYLNERFLDFSKEVSQVVEEDYNFPLEVRVNRLFLLGE
jgi:hypothetical protein